MKAKRVGPWLLAALLPVCSIVKAQEGPQIRVPEGNGRPILIDGIFTPGEWDDAVKVELRPGVQLSVKRGAGFVFLGVKYTKSDPRAFHGSVEVFISPDGASIRQLHVGAQMGERLLNKTPGLDDDPPFDWGDTSDWYANEGRWSERNIEALVKGGKSQSDAQRLSFYESDGFELQIRQAKFASDEWRVRLRTYKVEDETWDFHPRGTDTASTAGWLRLLMK